MDPILERYQALEDKVSAYTPNLDTQRLFAAFTYADAEQFAPGCLGEQMLQSFRTCRLEIGTHYLTGNQKDSDTCQECEDCSKRCSSAHISINLGPNLTKK